MYFCWTSVGLVAILVAWVIANSWAIVSNPAPESGFESHIVTNLRNIFGLGLTAAALAWLLVFWLENTTSSVMPAVLSAVLAIACLFIYPGAFRASTRDGSSEQVAEFSDWRRLIAPDDAVFVVPAHNSASFAWFTLQRPSYLSVDQSAGAVFSRATATEIRRRANVLLPVMQPDWKLLTGKATARSAGNAASKGPTVLTRNALVNICKDPILRFVVAREYVGFDPIAHTRVGEWRNWNLYDCRRVLMEAPPA